MTNTQNTRTPAQQAPTYQPGNVIVTTGGRRLLVTEVGEAVVHYDVLTPGGNRTHVRHWASHTTLATIIARVEVAR